jgi:hypothetical protein
MNRLRHFESWIEQLIEEPFVRLFAGRLLPEDVARHLVRALEEGEDELDDGTQVIPSTYRIALNPRDLAALEESHPRLTERLADSLSTLVSRMGAQLQNTPPDIILSADESVALHHVQIDTVEHEGTTPGDAPKPTEGSDIDPTQDIEVSQLQQMLNQQVGVRPRAYLIIEGDRVFDLEKPIINLGRAFDNDVILEDPRVSRHHAQLRQRYNRYVLRDLGSSGGTTVNGFPVQEIVLRPGDVISLPGTDLIYAESETPESPQDGDTQPLPLDDA